MVMVFHVDSGVVLEINQKPTLMNKTKNISHTSLNFLNQRPSGMFNSIQSTEGENSSDPKLLGMNYKSDSHHANFTKHSRSDLQFSPNCRNHSKRSRLDLDGKLPVKSTGDGSHGYRADRIHDAPFMNSVQLYSNECNRRNDVSKNSQSYTRTGILDTNDQSMNLAIPSLYIRQGSPSLQHYVNPLLGTPTSAPQPSHFIDSVDPNIVRTPHKSIDGGHSFAPKFVQTGTANHQSGDKCSGIDNAEKHDYVPGMDLLLMDAVELASMDLISEFGKSPHSSFAAPLVTWASGQATVVKAQMSFSRLDPNITQRPSSSPHTSPVSARSVSHRATRVPADDRHAQLRRERKRMEQQRERQPLPALHLHLSKDGSSPLPPGWQRARNTKQNPSASKRQDNGELDSMDMYAYYYYHTRTRQTRWDPPVYPWDADPTDTLSGLTGEDDPEAPYNWGCASKYAVTHDEIEAMYARLRQRILERQCTELLHDLADNPDTPRGAVEHGFAIELFTLVHTVLRSFRDARCRVGRIANDEDLYYLTKKLAQAVILKEVQKLHQAQAASSSSLFSTGPVPELTNAVQSRVSTYVKKYMESKGSTYRRRLQPTIIPPMQPTQSSRPAPHHHHHHHHVGVRPPLLPGNSRLPPISPNHLQGLTLNSKPDPNSIIGRHPLKPDH